MAYLPEQPEWTVGVYQLEKSDPVRGGVDGPANRPLIDLLKRTAWLKQRYEEAFSGLGWAELGEWAVGLEVTTPSQIVHYQGYWYRYGGSLPHTITGASPSLDDNDNWFNLGNDVSLRANLGSGEEGMGDYLLAAKLTVDGAVSRTQHDKNAESMSLMDLGGSRDAFDPTSYETMARMRATELRIPYLGYDQMMLPGMGLKVFKYCDGPYDRFPVVSIRNMMDPHESEPQSSIGGFANSAALANNSERGTASLYVHHVGQPVLFTTSNTTFTAESVTCSDLTSETISKIRVKQIINVTYDSATWSAFVLGVVDNTIYIEDAWYKVGGGGATGTPSNGSVIKLVPNNKSWGANIISSLNEDSDSNSLVGIELNTRNNKALAAGQGYGLDVVSNGAYNVGQGVQVRGACVFGFRNYTHNMYGFANTPEAGNLVYGFYDTSSTSGFYAWNNAYGITAKNSANYSLRVLDNDNGFQTGMGPTGTWQRLKLYATTTPTGSQISSFASITFVVPDETNNTVSMPGMHSGHTLTIKNRSSLQALTLTGPFEDGASSFVIPVKNAVTFYCDGSRWFPLNNYN
ncbi:TPA: hypothetical protein ACNP37_004874 [Raoultella ornithinolytica]